MKMCTLCPRNCAVDRAGGERGICGQTEQLKVARAALHYWEEPCISGESGSGAVFFSGCALHCVFCQNRSIANGTAGKEITKERLAEIFLELQEKGANNINLVTPGHFAPQITEALRRAKKEGLRLPVVYNTSSYESADTIKSLEGLVDIYLPDFKYISPALSAKYSHAPDYADVAKAAVAEMVRQCPRPVFDGDEAEDPIEEGLLMRQGPKFFYFFTECHHTSPPFICVYVTLLYASLAMKSRHLRSHEPLLRIYLANISTKCLFPAARIALPHQKWATPVWNCPFNL